MKRMLFVSMFLLLISVIYAEAGDALWQERNSVSGAKKVYEYYKAQYSVNPDYEISWKFSRAAYNYADLFVKDGNTKKIIFTEGKEAGEKAVSLKPQGVEGHLYLGTCLGSWAKANGIFASLRTIPVIFEEANKAIAINPSFADAAPYLLRGNVYMKAPKGKGGDFSKAESDFKKAINLAPNNRKGYRFYAELLVKMNQKEKAKEIAQKGLDIPIDESNKSSEEFEINELKNLLK